MLAGSVALVGLGLEDLPQLAPTRVSVSASFPAASPEVVEQSVTAVLEQQLNGLEGLESMSSSSRQGGASLSLRFESGDPELNAIKVQNEVNLASRRLPQAVTRQGLTVNRSTDDLLLILGFSAPPGLYEPIFIGGWLGQNLREALRRHPGSATSAYSEAATWPSDSGLIPTVWSCSTSQPTTSALRSLSRTCWPRWAALAPPQHQMVNCSTCPSTQRDDCAISLTSKPWWSNARKREGLCV